MSSFGFSSSDQSNYTYATAFQAPIPQYTQLQVNEYFLQYGCDSPQPYQVIPDFFPQPIAATTATFESLVAATSYDLPQWQGEMDHLQPPPSQARSRSSSRGKTWTCDITDCTSSTKFTRLAGLQRHQAPIHGVGRPDFPCTVPNCNRVGDRGFTRRDHLVEHLRNFHLINVPKRKPGERSAFPFGYPEDFQNQGVSSIGARVQGRRAGGSDQRGRIVKQERRATRATTTVSSSRLGSSSGIAGGRGATIDHILDAPHRGRSLPGAEERDGQITRTAGSRPLRSVSLGSSALELVDTLLSLGYPGESSQAPSSHDTVPDPWNLP